MDRETRHAQAVTANRLRTPRASKLADTLFDLARDHSIAALETLAIEIDGNFCQRGVEITEAEWARVFRAGVNAMNDAARS